MGAFGPSFSDYDNPKRARVIWNAYLSDFNEKGKAGRDIRQEATEIVMSCSTCWDLDMELDKIVSSDDFEQYRRNSVRNS